jgi:Domain of unknown function (DUF4169)/CcdB protein
VLQADRLFHTSTVVVAPLVHADRLREDQALYPVFETNGQRVGLMINELATVPRRILKSYVKSLGRERHRVIRSIDTLFSEARGLGMADIINLRHVRKGKARAEKEARAAENRAKFGRTKEERRLGEAREHLAERRIEAHRRDDASK